MGLVFRVGNLKKLGSFSWDEFEVMPLLIADLPGGVGNGGADVWLLRSLVQLTDYAQELAGVLQRFLIDQHPGHILVGWV